MSVRRGYIPNGVSCSIGKRMYATRSDAKAAARRAHPSDKLHAYRCDTCDYWHIGHATTPSSSYWAEGRQRPSPYVKSPKS